MLHVAEEVRLGDLWSASSVYQQNGQLIPLDMLCNIQWRPHVTVWMSSAAGRYFYSCPSLFASEQRRGYV